MVIAKSQQTIQKNYTPKFVCNKQDEEEKAAATISCVSAAFS